MTTAVEPEIQTPSGTIVLRMPNPHPDDGRENPLANLDFGPVGKRHEGHETLNIVFYEMEPGVGTAVVRNDHPLLEDLMRKYPQVQVETGGPATVYLCGICDNGKEYGGKLQLRNHMKMHARRGENDPKEE